MSRVSTSKHVSQSRTLSAATEHQINNRMIAIGLSMLIARHGVRLISEKTGIPAKDLFRYAKGGPIKKSNIKKLDRLADIDSSQKPEMEKPLQATADCAL